MAPHSIDLTRMECKVDSHSGFPSSEKRIDLTRMECKGLLSFDKS